MAAERLYASMRMKRTLFAGILGAARGTLNYGRWCSPCHGVVEIDRSHAEVGCN